MTNYEKIKNMSVEDIADEMLKIVDCVCGIETECQNCPFSNIRQAQGICSYGALKEWLESEVEE